MEPGHAEQHAGQSPRPNRDWYIFAGLLGLASFAVILAFHNLTDGDLWARLAAGAAVFETGRPLARDIFAFTPILPKWIDHEWGTGVVFFACLKWLGPASLLWLKILLGMAALGLALFAGWRLGGRRASLLLLAPVAGSAILPGFIPVVRSHVFTYALFALLAVILEAMRNGRRWPALAVPFIMLVWIDLHGGFVAGLGLIGVYTLAAIVTRNHARIFLLTALAILPALLITPYGLDFWRYLIPALLHKRELIVEWGPMPLLKQDIFVGFRVACAMALIVVIAGWRRNAGRHSWPALVMLILTAVLAWRHQRHAPFFGVMLAVVVPAYLEPLFVRAFAMPGFGALRRITPAILVVALHAVLACLTLGIFLPATNWCPAAPDGFCPAKGTAILRQSGLTGNLAVSFRWGSYAAWCLHPRIKISMDGRYEETYPESTLHLNEGFFNKHGADWQKLVRDYKVDFIIVETARTRLTDEDLGALGYQLICRERTYALWSLAEHAPRLIKTRDELPSNLPNMIDARIPAAWW